MPPIPAFPSADITFEQIRERAYDLWERHHRPEDFSIALWLMAERELRAERDARAGGESRGRGTSDEGGATRGRSGQNQETAG